MATGRNPSQVEYGVCIVLLSKSNLNQKYCVMALLLFEKVIFMSHLYIHTYIMTGLWFHKNAILRLIIFSSIALQ